MIPMFDEAMKKSGSADRPHTLLLDPLLRVDVNTGLAEPLDDNRNNNNKSEVLDNGSTRRRKNRLRRRPATKQFNEVYRATGETLGEGSYASVQTYENCQSHKQFAVKVIEKTPGRSRCKVFKEIEIFHHCQNQPNILHLQEYFEEDDRFLLIFDKMEGGTLLESVERRGHLTEREASLVVRDIATALNFLHDKGIAHRDLKPENILCEKPGDLVPVRICDFDLASGMIFGEGSPVTTPTLQTPVGSAEYMAPEVVNAWVGDSFSYDKKCDLWSLGIILYIMLCGYPPFYGQCGMDCGWERGESCQDCQESLFTRIQNGDFVFPPGEWDDISQEAKDLICNLLVRDPKERYSARDVLTHPWVSTPPAPTPLNTPSLLCRNNSTKDLESFADTAISINRMMQQHLTISDANKSLGYHDNRYHDIGSTSSDEGIDMAGTFNLSLPSSELAQRRRRKTLSNDSLSVTFPESISSSDDIFLPSDMVL